MKYYDFLKINNNWITMKIFGQIKKNLNGNLSFATTPILFQNFIKIFLVEPIVRMKGLIQFPKIWGCLL